MDINRIKSEPVLAEFFGTFLLTFAFLAAIQGGITLLSPVVVGGFALAALVLLLGTISGAQLNPAITMGLYSLRRIDAMNAVGNIVAQLSGALLAMVVLSLFSEGTIFELGSNGDWTEFWSELLGASVLGFGYAATLFNRLNILESAVAIGTSFTLGMLFASLGSNGLVNPAIALGLGSSSWPYVFGPFLGAFVGANAFRLLLPPHYAKKR